MIAYQLMVDLHLYNLLLSLIHLPNIYLTVVLYQVNSLSSIPERHPPPPLSQKKHPSLYRYTQTLTLRKKYRRH